MEIVMNTNQKQKQESNEGIPDMTLTVGRESRPSSILAGVSEAT
jgi:hypothetical protein